MTRWFLLGCFVVVSAACGGATKPPLQPDTDPTSPFADGGSDDPARALPSPSSTPPH